MMEALKVFRIYIYFFLIKSLKEILSKKRQGTTQCVYYDPIYCIHV